MTISFSRSDGTVQPSACVQNRARPIVSVNHDVVESDGQAGSMRGTLDRIPETRCLPRTGRSPKVTPRDSAQIAWPHCAASAIYYET